MIEDNVRVVLEIIRSFFKSPVGMFLYAAISSIIGIVILLTFLSFLVQPGDLVIFLPFIVAFNAAASGFAVTGKDVLFTWRKTVFLSLGALLTLAGCFLITLFCPWEPFWLAERWFTTLVFSCAAVWLGGWIGDKNSKLLQKR